MPGSEVYGTRVRPGDPPAPATYPTVRLRLRGPAAAVAKLFADLEAAELPWCQVLGAGEPVEQRGETTMHLIVQVRVAERLEGDEEGWSVR